MEKEYTKDFDGWNERQKTINERLISDDFFFLEGEIWWTSIGVNIGREIDGKNDYFERPILVLKKFTEDTFLGLPLSTKEKSAGDFHIILYKEKKKTIYLQQMRFLSSNRLLQLITRIDEDTLGVIRNKVLKILGKEEIS